MPPNPLNLDPRYSDKCPVLECDYYPSCETHIRFAVWGARPSLYRSNALVVHAPCFTVRRSSMYRSNALVVGTPFFTVRRLSLCLSKALVARAPSFTDRRSSLCCSSALAVHAPFFTVRRSSLCHSDALGCACRSSQFADLLCIVLILGR